MVRFIHGAIHNGEASEENQERDSRLREVLAEVFGKAWVLVLCSWYNTAANRYLFLNSKSLSDTKRTPLGRAGTNATAILLF